MTAPQSPTTEARSHRPPLGSAPMASVVGPFLVAKYEALWGPQERRAS